MGYTVEIDNKQVMITVDEKEKILNLRKLIDEHGLDIVAKILNNPEIPLSVDSWRPILASVIDAIMNPNLDEYYADAGVFDVNDILNIQKEVEGLDKETEIPKPAQPKDEEESENKEELEEEIKE